MQDDDNLRIIFNNTYLNEVYIPSNIIAREEQIRDLEFCLSPARCGQMPTNAWIYGRPGTGKTVTCKYVLRKFEKEANIRALFINCWENPTFFSVLDKMVKELRILGAEKLNSSFKFERLQNFLKGKPLIVFLDEIDQPQNKERESILYNFCNMQNIEIGRAHV